MPQLVDSGFTEDQAGAVVLYFANSNINLPLENVQPWLQLLPKLQVHHPHQLLSKKSILLASKASAAEVNATSLVELLQDLGATPEIIQTLISKKATLLTFPHATPSPISAWLRSNLSLSSSAILNVLFCCPELFSRSREDLDVTLAWLTSNGVSIESIIQKPEVLGCDVSSSATQGKARFLTQAMGKDASELLAFPHFFKCSLSRVGPRWAFHNLYCNGQPFHLKPSLQVTDAQYVQRLDSTSLDAECSSRGKTRGQLYAEFRAKWSKVEGKKWDMRNAREGKE